jgi:hypothetical protein
MPIDPSTCQFAKEVTRDFSLEWIICEGLEELYCGSDLEALYNQPEVISEIGITKWEFRDPSI